MSDDKTKKTDEMEDEVGVDAEKNIKEESGEEPVAENKDLMQLVLDQQQRIAELERKVDELKEGNLRKSAELDNMKKRMQRDRAQIYESAKIAALEQFLPVNDDLIRSLKVIEESDIKSESGVEDAVKLIYNKFQDVLKQYDIEPIDQAGVPFDVDLHDALIRQKSNDDNIESDMVLEVLENGYRMGDRTIRHAKVIVSE